VKVVRVAPLEVPKVTVMLLDEGDEIVDSFDLECGELAEAVEAFRRLKEVVEKMVEAR